MLVSVSFLKNNDGIKNTIDKINSSKADFIHVDIKDGKFTSNNTNDKEIKEALLNVNKELDIHLMVEHPLEYINLFKELKPKYITFHIESLDNINEVIKCLKDNNIKVGIALNPETRIYNILPYIKDIDLILVMSVNPGKGGQSFISNTYSKVNELKAMQVKYNYIISVDGGINNETVKGLKSDMVVSGSYVVLSDNYDDKINTLK